MKDKLDAQQSRLVILSGDIWDTHRALMKALADQYSMVEFRFKELVYNTNAIIDKVGELVELTSEIQRYFSLDIGLIQLALSKDGHINTNLSKIHEVLAQSGNYGGISGKLNYLQPINSWLGSLYSNTDSKLSSLVMGQQTLLEDLDKVLGYLNQPGNFGGILGRLGYLQYINSWLSSIDSTLKGMAGGKVDLTADLSPVTARLDAILALMTLTGLGDLISDFLGEFDFPTAAALSGQVSAAMQNAFPFCVPAILKQLLGIMEVEPQAATFDLEIMGASVGLDFDAQGFSQVANVTSWLTRIFFVVLLLTCTRRFIFNLSGKGGE